ncbi:hypothetical protein [Pantoea phytobeneficialis]|uniref:Uncharacterized protein n=1 Tax=Pantoea phytobeneficialis TaxID=2052056 RepID=A0AAP9H5R9_9GAMM|nr:hypothetical protein [Pantoea phytobeneficialis]MDO6410072.1 hypothetical protein [Pantoea phytobeneficialis]QGR07173.1 hypothetical protein CTZ24_12385 [Pantoea phytobeneficialis]
MTIWTAILGYSLSELPALFLFPHFTQQLNWKIFLTRITVLIPVSAALAKAFAILCVRLYKSPLLSTTAQKDDAAVRRARQICVYLAFTQAVSRMFSPCVGGDKSNEPPFLFLRFTALNVRAGNPFHFHFCFSLQSKFCSLR